MFTGKYDGVVTRLERLIEGHAVDVSLKQYLRRVSPENASSKSATQY